MEIAIEKRWLKNCLSVVNSEKGWQLNRFTPKQMREYAEAGNETIRLRSLCPAGVMLDLRTNARVLRFHYHMERIHGSQCHFDVYINDLFVHSVLSNPEGVFHFHLEEQSAETRNPGDRLNRVSVYFPHYSEVYIKELHVSDGAIVEEVAPKPKNLLVVGSSSSQGRNARYPSSSYAVLLSRYLDMNLLNQAVGSYYFERNSLDPDLPFEPDQIIVQYGGNDWAKWSSIDIFQRQCHGYMEKLLRIFPGVPVLVLTPWSLHYNKTYPMGSFRELADTIRTTCREFPMVSVVDGTLLIPRFADYFEKDGVHPTDEGFLHIALNLTKHIVNA